MLNIKNKKKQLCDLTDYNDKAFMQDINCK